MSAILLCSGYDYTWREEGSLCPDLLVQRKIQTVSASQWRCDVVHLHIEFCSNIVIQSRVRIMTPSPVITCYHLTSLLSTRFWLVWNMLHQIKSMRQNIKYELSSCQEWRANNHTVYPFFTQRPHCFGIRVVFNSTWRWSVPLRCRRSTLGLQSRPQPPPSLLTTSGLCWGPMRPRWSRWLLVPDGENT